MKLKHDDISEQLKVLSRDHERDTEKLSSAETKSESLMKDLAAKSDEAMRERQLRMEV